jgi:hypothetical protein
MVARIWHGFTTRENSSKYEAMLKPDVLPGLDKIAGYKGSYLLRKDHGSEVEFITVMLWESLDAIRAVGEKITNWLLFPRSVGKFYPAGMSVLSISRLCKDRDRNSFPRAIESGDPKCVRPPQRIAISSDSHTFQHFVRSRKTRDRCRQISIGPTYTRNQRPDFGQNISEVEAIKFSQQTAGLAKVENANFAVGAEHAIYLIQPSIIICEIAKAECGNHEIEALVRKWQTKSICLHRLNAIRVKLS